MAVPTTLVFFLLFKLVFRLSLGCWWSVFFTKFDCFVFLFVLMFDGNVQQFAFHMTSEWTHIFYFTLPQKLLKVGVILFGFLLVFGSCSFYLMCFSFLGKTNDSLIDNNRNTAIGQGLLLAQVGLRNFLLGLLNSWLRFMEYRQMMGVLRLLSIRLSLVLPKKLKHMR